MKHSALIAAVLVLAGPAAAAKEPVQHVIIDPQPAIAEAVVVAKLVPTMLFGGITPANGFSVQQVTPGGEGCVLNDAGTASYDSQGFPTGFTVPWGGNGAAPYTTPLTYKPIGPVSIVCLNNATVNARAW